MPKTTVTVIATNELSDMWAAEEDFAGMTDVEIIELIREDVLAFWEEATITVVKERRHDNIRMA